MNSIVEDTLNKLKECDDFHNRCDCLLEHSEITYLLDYMQKQDKEIERLNNILDKLDLLDKDIDKETKFVNMTVTLPKYLKDIGKKNKINFSKLLQESLYEVLELKGEDKE